jgi:periplasmic protein TonB
MNFLMQRLFKIIFIFAAIILVSSQCKNDHAHDTLHPETLSIDTSQVYQVSTIAPRFPGCETLSTDIEKKNCADKKLLEYLYAHIQYPVYAKEHGVQGRCVVSFIIEKNGFLSNIKTLKDIGGGCGEASLSVVNAMNEPAFIKERGHWIPGVDHDQNVRVQYYLPVNFRLEEKVEK